MVCGCCRRENPDNVIYCIDCGERLYTEVLIDYIKAMNNDEYEIFVGNYIEQ